MSSLLFITSTRIGDAVLSTGALALARARVPDARVTIACGPLAAPLFRAEPGLAELIVMKKAKYGAHWIDLWRKLAGRRFDLAVDLRGSAVTYLIGARRRLVFHSRGEKGHKLDEFAALFGACAAPEMNIAIDDKARADADAFLGPPRRTLVLGASANWAGKVWSRENFGALARDLAGPSGPLAGALIVLLGGPEDRAALDALAADLRAAGLDARSSAGELDLLACAALLQRCALFVGNDSGLMHLSGAMRAPTLGLFGPTDERVYGPRGPRARAIRGPRSFEDVARAIVPRVEQVSLMGDLSVAAVAAAAREMLA